MSRVAFDYDEATAIPLPGPGLASDVAEEWADGAAARMAALNDLDDTSTRTLARALARAQRSAASDPSTNLLLREPATGAWVPLRLTLADGEPDAVAQRSFLWPASILAPRIRVARSRSLGTGCSSTVLVDDRVAQVRWLFATTGKSFFATLGPVAPALLAMVAARVEILLDTVQIGGAPWAPSDHFDPDALSRSGVEPESLWRI